MKRAKADRILYDVGYWMELKRKKRRWVSILPFFNSRRLARSVRDEQQDDYKERLVVRRAEIFYIETGA